MVLYESIDKNFAASWTIPGISASLFAAHNGHAQDFSTATASEADNISSTELVQRLNNHNFPRNIGTDLVVFRSVTILTSFKNFRYPYKCITINEISEMLGDIFFSDIYAWDSQAMSLATAGSRLTEVQPSGPQRSENESTAVEDPQSEVESGRNTARYGQSKAIRTAIFTDEDAEIEDLARSVQAI